MQQIEFKVYTIFSDIQSRISVYDNELCYPSLAYFDYPKYYNGIYRYIVEGTLINLYNKNINNHEKQN